jgi:hypothetical protein
MGRAAAGRLRRFFLVLVYSAGGAFSIKRGAQEPVLHGTSNHD